MFLPTWMLRNHPISHDIVFLTTFLLVGEKSWPLLVALVKNRVTRMAFKECLHFIWICSCHCLTNDSLHLELRLAPHLVDSILMKQIWLIEPGGEDLAKSRCFFVVKRNQRCCSKRWSGFRKNCVTVETEPKIPFNKHHVQQIDALDIIFSIITNGPRSEPK